MMQVRVYGQPDDCDRNGAQHVHDGRVDIGIPLQRWPGDHGYRLGRCVLSTAPQTTP